MSKPKRNGQSLVEFALILPILILLLLGIAEGAHVIQSYLSAQFAVREAARYAVSGQPLSASNDPWTLTPKQRVPFIKNLAVTRSEGTGFTQVITDVANYDYGRRVDCDESCAGILAVRVDSVEYFTNGTINETETIEDHPGIEGSDVRVSLYHNVAIWDPIYAAIVPNGYLTVEAKIVMRNEGGQTIAGPASPYDDGDNPPPQTPEGGENKSPFIRIQDGDTHPVGSTIVIRLGFHDTGPVNVFVDGDPVVLNPISIDNANGDGTGNGITTYVIPFEKPVGTYRVESQTLAGVFITYTDLTVTKSTTPIIITGGDVWPLGSVITYTLSTHEPNTYEVGMINAANQTKSLPSVTTDASREGSGSAQLIGSPLTAGEWTIRSMLASTEVASRTLTLTNGCIRLNQGDCGEVLETPNGVYLYISLDSHAFYQNYITELVNEDLAPDDPNYDYPINSNVFTDGKGQAFVVYFLPLNLPDGENYYIRSYQNNALRPMIAETRMVVDTPLTPFIHVDGGYKWPAGTTITFLLRNHEPNTQYDIYWEGTLINDTADPTDENGSLFLKYTIPVEMPQGFEYNLQSIPHNQNPASNPYTAISPFIEVVPKPYLKIAEGPFQIPGTTVTVELHNHNINSQYEVYAEEPGLDLPGRKLPGNPVATNNVGNSSISYAIPSNLLSDQNIRITSYLLSQSPTISTAQTTLGLLAADLQITNIQVPPNPDFNGAVPITVTVKNVSGVTITHRSFDIDLYILEPADAQPNLGRSLPPGDVKVWIQPPLGISQTQVVTALMPIYGAYDRMLWARADTSNRIPESNENNNLASTSVSPGFCEVKLTTTGDDNSTRINWQTHAYGDALQVTDTAPRIRLTGAGGIGPDDEYFVYRPITATILPGVLNFNNHTLSSYTTDDQSDPADTETLDGGLTLHMEGNNWKKVEFAYDVTANTVLEFDYRSDREGEIQGIGFDNDDNYSGTYWRLYGSQNYGYNTHDNYSGTDWVHYTINVGDEFTGQMQYLTFINDDDGGTPRGNSYFRNVKVYEDISGDTIFFDDFEGGNTGWVVNPNSTDTAIRGMWEPAAVPATDDNQLSPYSGSRDLVTGANSRAADGNNNDIDNGVTSVRSPDITLPPTGDITLDFSYYYNMDRSSSPHTTDYFRVTVVGQSSSTVLNITTSPYSPVWTAFSNSLNAFAGQTVYLLFEAADETGPSYVEAGVDDVRISVENGNGEVCDNTGWINPAAGSIHNVWSNLATNIYDANTDNYIYTTDNNRWAMFWNYGFGSLPTNAQITSIDVLLDSRINPLNRNPYFRTRLSWDNGSHWTSQIAQPTPATTARTKTVIGTINGSGLPWSRNWTLAELTTLRTEIETARDNNGATPNPEFRLYNLPVRVSYCTPDSGGGDTESPTSNFEVQARLLARADTVSGAWGLEVRQNVTDANASKMNFGFAGNSSGGSLSFATRPDAGSGTISAADFPGTTPLWIRIVKVGADFELYTATDDGSGSHTGWGTAVRTFSIDELAGDVTVGMFSNSLTGTADDFDFDYFKICEANSECAGADDILYEAPTSETQPITSEMSDAAFGGSLSGTPSFAIVTAPTVGNPSFNVSGDTITINNNGSGAWQNNDDFDNTLNNGSGFLYGYHQVSGNFDVRVRVTDLSDLTTDAAAGLEIRAGLEGTAEKIDWAKVNGQALEYLHRYNNGSSRNAASDQGDEMLPVWIRIVRIGDEFSLYYVADTTYPNPPDSLSWGAPVTTLSAGSMPNTLFVGLFNTPYDSATRTTATFSGYHVCVNPSGSSNSGAGCGEVRESGGMVIINATNFTDNTPSGDGDEWTPTTRDGVAGLVIPDSSGNYYTFDSGAPQVQYDVDITNPGTYYAWVLGYGSNTNNNSIYIDRTGTTPSDGITFATGNFDWSNTTNGGGNPYTISLPNMGNNKISVWVREDGFEFFQILLTNDPTFRPSGTDYGQSQCSSAPEEDLPPGLLTCADALVNGTFENDSDWYYSSIAQQVTRTSLPHYFDGGSFAMSLPATTISGRSRSPWLYQNFDMLDWVVPPTANGGTSLNLRLYAAVNPEGTANPDPLYVTLRDQAGQPIGSVTPIVVTTGNTPPYINPDNPDPLNGEWVKKTINLAGAFNPPEAIMDYQGQSMQLRFESPNPGTYSTWFYLDNIEMEICTQQPAPTSFTTKVSGTAIIWQEESGKWVEQPGVKVWLYAIDGNMETTYTIHDSTFNFYNLPAATGGTQYILYAEYSENSVTRFASSVFILMPGQKLTSLLLFLQ